MRHFVEIDDRTKTGESILLVLKNLSQTSKSVVFKSLEEIEEELDTDFANNIEEVDDPQLLAKMLNARKSGYVRREKVMNTLKNILEK